MTHSGHLRKLRTELDGDTATYQLPLDDTRIPLNPLIGQPLRLIHTGEIRCVACGRKTRKSFNQGYCYPCFRDLPECDSCIVKPEQCHYFAGTCRDPAWGEQHCLQDHIVYLANSSGLKVGITRASQIPTRWIDQGATQALPVFRVANRLLSGKLEVILKQHVADRTDWRKMLKGVAESQDLRARRDELLARCADDIAALVKTEGEDRITALPDAEPLSIDYPVSEYPAKVASRNFDKTPNIEGTLLGIKGQYLILDTGVLNIRKFAGYHVELVM